MTKLIWRDGPPPHIGWWNASMARNPETWRWWNGNKWSITVFADDTIASVTEAATKPALSQWDIEWTRYWPENARVPREKPQ